MVNLWFCGCVLQCWNCYWSTESLARVQPTHTCVELWLKSGPEQESGRSTDGGYRGQFSLFLAFGFTSALCVFKVCAAQQHKKLKDIAAL